MTENESKKPKEDDPKVAAVQTQASTESVAQEATSRQSLDESAPEADKARAPNLGIGKDKQRLAADWGRQISAYFELHKRYPKVKKNKTATVKVSLVAQSPRQRRPGRRRWNPPATRLSTKPRSR